jgi:DNA polymerase-4
MVRRFRALYWISRGVDKCPVRANRIRKSVGAESTFSQNLNDYGAPAKELQPLIDKVSLSGTTASPPVPGSDGATKGEVFDFELITRSRSVAPISTSQNLASLDLEPLKQLMAPKSIRLLGISVSGFTWPEVNGDQLPLMLD